MRTLIDLLNNELGYARIFAEREGYGYELTTYRPRTIADLFERMSGYPSAEVALTFAQQQLESIVQPPIKLKRRKTQASPRRGADKQRKLAGEGSRGPIVARDSLQV